MLSAKVVSVRIGWFLSPEQLLTFAYDRRRRTFLWSLNTQTITAKEASDMLRDATQAGLDSLTFRFR
jgi:hypothetical protein